MGIALSAPVRGQTDGGCDPPEWRLLHERVIDRQTRVPLRDATVVVTWRSPAGEQQRSARTDSVGRARLCGPPQQEIGVRAEYRNVQSSSLSVVLALATVNTHTVAIDVPYIYAQGIVVDHATDAPVANAIVRLSHTDLDVLTGADGRFVIARVPIGDYQLSVEHPAYRTATTSLQAHGPDLNAMIRVTPEAMPLPRIMVTAFSRRLDRVGFYDRERRGSGTFIGRAQIEAARVQYASDLLRSVPGVRLITTAARRGAPRSFTSGRGDCRFRFIVDGTRVLPDFELDNIAPIYIEGIEVYTGMAQVPALFRAQAADGVGSTCGIIAVWTRDSR